MSYYSAPAGLQIATQSASTTFYSLTDHNRQPLDISYEIIEKAQRMANGTMRKFVVSKKKKISVSWSDVPSGTEKPYNPIKSGTSASNTNQGYTMTVDGYKGGAWMKSFYENNLFKPIILRVSHSQDTASLNTASAFYPSPSASAYEDQWVFITNFTYNIKKRYGTTDLVDISMEFTEI